VNGKLAKLFCVAAVYGALLGCNADRAENCERLGYYPDNHDFEIDYKIRVPAKCVLLQRFPNKSPARESYTFAGDHAAALIRSSRRRSRSRRPCSSFSLRSANRRSGSPR